MSYVSDSVGLRSYRPENRPGDRGTRMAAESTVTQASLPPVDLPFSCKTNVSRRDHHQKRFSGRAREYLSISPIQRERERQENVSLFSSSQVKSVALDYSRSQ